MLFVSKFLLAAILCIATSQVVYSTGKDGCSGDEPHPTECTQFFRCIQGIRNRMYCPEGEIFDNIQICNCGNNTRPVEGQKDLLIVFDATGSMKTDLAQLRAAAIEIVNELARKEDDPIHQFILSIFRDPWVEDVFVTTDPSALITELNKIKAENVGSNPDCPELALLGLKNALEAAAPNSIAFLFSDASAKDYHLFEDVKKIIQDKQIEVNFLLTGNCNKPNSPEALVYGRIAVASGGQVFDMKNTDIKEVLVMLSLMLDMRFEALMSFDFEKAGSNVVSVNVDASFETLMISAAGTNAELAIRNSKNQTVAVSNSVSLSNIKIVTLDVTDSEYWIDSSAKLAYSLRIGGISDMSFDFGFSVRPAGYLNETQQLPIADRLNILTVFVTNAGNLESLQKVSLISTSDSSQSIEIPLSKSTSGVFATALFDVPDHMFKIRVYGVDKEDNVVDRIISTGIEINRNESTTQIPAIECEYLASGVAPHPTDCTKYYKCINGITYDMICPEGQIFDVYTHTCGENSVCAH